MISITTKLAASLFLLVLTLQAPIPVAKEPRHHVKFQNKYVRVIDAAVPPGDATLFHIHSADNVPVAISGGISKTEPLGGDPVESTVLTGSVSFRKASYTHRITNIGHTMLRFIDAEVLASPGSPANAALLDKVPGHKLVLENERVRIYQLTLEPGQSTGVHTHQLFCLSVAVSQGRLLRETIGKKPRPVDFDPGDFRWQPGGMSHSLKNIGPNRFEAVDIEWK